MPEDLAVSIGLSHLLTVKCTLRPVRKQDTGPHVACKLLQVSVEVVLIEERLVIVISDSRRLISFLYSTSAAKSFAFSDVT